MKNTDRPLFLIGMRASGKTTVGRTLAERLGYAFVDLDLLLRQQLGKEVAEIVAQEGWEGFREHEARILRQACAPRTVIATGGGAVLRADNREFLLQAGHCIYLKASPETLIERLLRDPNLAQRPRLGGRPDADQPDAYHPGEEIRETLRQRAALYHQAAHTVIDAEQDITELVDELAALVLNTSPGQEERP